MNKIDTLLMDLQRHLTHLFYRILFFFCFKKYRPCKGFCVTCAQFDECMEVTKRTYKQMHQ